MRRINKQKVRIIHLLEKNIIYKAETQVRNFYINLAFFIRREKYEKQKSVQSIIVVGLDSENTFSHSYLYEAAEHVRAVVTESFFYAYIKIYF